ncbi:PREDICTED: ras-related protein SEC4-like [Amphimedon queenslandica]|uniref:Uncharacterized protein n=1 Tax=Amphimedon queenslandica TaxID=400682 RepID=A0A1X7U0J5_AMPQE|nr:PREDICTED: ras-related protein SEC4-like [Amphimedon queenslandica]|eukprot:XP_011406319.1 PREDICTED: ras-related protein SEC4-like [Amphimedon queenslandica]
MQAQGSPYEVLLKIILIGDTGSQKTELLQKYMGEVPGMEDSLGPTLGLDYRLKDITHNKKRVKLQLWDTAGQERFRSVTSSYYRGSQGCLLVFNAAKSASFSGISYWLDEIKTNAPSNFQTVLVATGIDDPTTEEQLVIAREFAKEKGLTFKEVNLGNLSQIEDAFNTVIGLIMSKDSPRSDPQDSIIMDQNRGRSERSDRCAC